jgi:hypothetical protein
MLDEHPCGDRRSASDFADCFDPALAEFPTRIVSLAQVVDLLHVTHRPDEIERFRQAIEAGDRFPPISVVHLAGRFFVADGHKRFSAYAALSVSQIVVEIWTTRRWLQDQWRQFRHKSRQQCRLAFRSLFEQRARAEARRLVLDTIRHWRRIVVSLTTRPRRS